MSNVELSLVLPCTYYYLLSPWIFQSHQNCYCNVKFHVDFTELKETISIAHYIYISLLVVFTSSIRQLSFMVPLLSCIFFKQYVESSVLGEMIPLCFHMCDSTDHSIQQSKCPLVIRPHFLEDILLTLYCLQYTSWVFS